MWTIAGFNTADAESATRVLAACCASPVWAEGLATGRPYASLAALTDAALAAFDALDDAEIERAVDAHPRIGGAARPAQPVAVPAGFGATADGTDGPAERAQPATAPAGSGTAAERVSRSAGSAIAAEAEPAPGAAADRRTAPLSGPEAEWSRGEQARAMTADAAVKADLADANAAYERRFDRVFLICATGLAAEDILAAARRRLGNDDATERAETRAELRKIVALRLGKAFGEDR